MVDPLARLGLDVADIEAFCKTWRIVEFTLFGSILRDDFGPDSDVDVLVTFAPDAGWSLLDFVGIELALASLVGRDVDLVERASVEQSPNYIKRRHVLENLRTLYVA